MKHMIFREAEQYPIALLVKAAAFIRSDLEQNYIEELNQLGVPSEKIIGFTLEYNDSNKAPAGFIKDYLSKLLPALNQLGVQYLYVADANYFKVLTNQRKAEPHVGYVLPCKIEGFEHMQVVLGLNHQALMYNPDIKPRLDLSLKTLANAVLGTYQALGQGIIKKAEYPDSLETITNALERVQLWDTVAIDIEGFSLRFHEAGIGTICFAQDHGKGIAFACDYKPLAEPVDGLYGEFVINAPVRALLRRFFERYMGRARWHGSPYDMKAIIYALWMKDALDYEGMLQGLEVMTRCFDDTMTITYLATNSTAGNKLGLKDQAHEFAGNWAQEDIKDIRRIPLPQLLEYNLVDGLSTNWLYDKQYPVMCADQQEQLYEELMLPALKVIIQMELVGMPLSLRRVAEIKAQLQEISDRAISTIENHPVVQQLNHVLQHNAMVAANSKLKIKQHPIEKFADVKFNPNSGPQMQILFHEVMGLPIIDLTKTKQPATGADTIEKLINHTTDTGYKEVLNALIEYGQVNKILSTYIPPFEEALVKGDGWAYLHGSFKLGGTISGRLSSSDPNLQNIPSKSIYGELVKLCFAAPPGKLFCGADFMSLEDRINALVTKDPNKLKVYTDGFDGHCLRAYAYFGDQMTGIMDTVDSINSIKKLYDDLRQESKVPTFALTYLGTWRTLVKNLGWSEEKAKKVENAYRELYAASIAWVEEQIQLASKRGYAEGAFGLRIRTPLLAQTILGLKSTPREAEAEARTLGNAISGQSYGLLNTRAANEFMKRVWASPYRLKIMPVAQIHDAIYLLIDNDLPVVEWVNRNLIEVMQWQELPEIQHPQVKLGAELDLYWPNWATPVTLPNNATPLEIWKLCSEHLKKVREEGGA